MKRFIAVVCIGCLLVCTAAQAHNAYKETTDFTTSKPFVVPDPSASMVVFAYLSVLDVDTYTFAIPPAMKPIMDASVPPKIIGWEKIMIPLTVPVVDANGKVVMDFTQMPPKPKTTPVVDKNGAPVMWPLAAKQVLLNPVALVPACAAYANYYPSIGLSGPGLPGHKATNTSGTLMGFSRPVSGQARPLYTIYHDAMNQQVDNMTASLGCVQEPLGPDDDLSMFLPYGLSQYCIHCAPNTCDSTNVVTWYSIYAGDYKVQVFNTSGIAGDYILSMGIGESATCAQLAQTITLMKQAIDGTIWRKPCIGAGESGFIGCP